MMNNYWEGEEFILREKDLVEEELYLYLLLIYLIVVKLEFIIVCMKCEEEIKVWYLKEY